MNTPIIGILGGMGSYATLNLFKELLDAFPAKKEWDRPRIIIDNRCDMPSRVRAILHNENRDKLVDEMTKSIRMFIDNGVTHIILACNTSHVFLNEIYTEIPEAKGKIVHIIKEAARQIAKDGHKKVFLLASEGTIETRIFSKYCAPYNIEIVYPKTSDFETLRGFIEAVKQNQITQEVVEKFKNYINQIETDTVILGCTELPILYKNCKNEITKSIYDPLKCAIEATKSSINV